MTENMDVRLKEVVDTLQTNCYLQEDMDIGLKMGRVGPVPSQAHAQSTKFFRPKHDPKAICALKHGSIH